jgi:tetratricopeptide (TPR) repeat protein
MRRLRLIGVLATAGMMASGCAHGPAQLLPSPPLLRGEAPRLDDQEQAAQALPTDETVRLLVVHGDKLVENGRESLAVAQYEKARALRPDYPGLAHKLAVLYDRLAQDQKAAAEYRRALDQQPHDPSLLNDFGYFHYQRGRYAEAEKYFRQALEICERGGKHWSLPWKAVPEPAQENLRDRVCVNLGLALAQQQRYQEALATFAKVLTPAQAHYNLAVVMLQQAGHLPPERQADQTRLQQQARSHLQQALRLDGSLRQAHALLNELENPQPLTPPAPPTMPGPKGQNRSRNGDSPASQPGKPTASRDQPSTTPDSNSQFLTPPVPVLHPPTVTGSVPPPDRPSEKSSPTASHSEAGSFPRLYQRRLPQRSSRRFLSMRQQTGCRPYRLRHLFQLIPPFGDRRRSLPHPQLTRRIAISRLPTSASPRYLPTKRTSPLRQTTSHLHHRGKSRYAPHFAATKTTDICTIGLAVIGFRPALRGDEND